MFEDSLMESEARKKARRRWITFPASVLLHALVITIALVGPLLTADANLPEVKVINVFMAAAPPPPPPPPPPPQNKIKKKI